MIVVDTNVIAYLLIESERTPACRAVYEADSEWCAPAIWRSEFRNVLTMHMRHQTMTLTGALERMKTAERLLEERVYLVSSETVLRLALESSVSAYDAEFVALAKSLETKFVTSDKRVLRAFSHVAYGPESFLK